MVAVELVSDRETKARFPAEVHVRERLSEKFQQQGLILRPLSDNFVGMSPPLCITRSEVDEIVAVLDRSFGELENELAASK